MIKIDNSITLNELILEESNNNNNTIWQYKRATLFIVEILLKLEEHKHRENICKEKGQKQIMWRGTQK